jgi:hypothetical protein
MARHDSPPDAPEAPDAEPAPELADWWVWGVRQVAGVIAPLLFAARSLAVLFVVLKLINWWLSNDRDALRQVGYGIVAFVAFWLLALLLHQFATERDAPDPGRWLTSRRRG